MAAPQPNALGLLTASRPLRSIATRRARADSADREGAARRAVGREAQARRAASTPRATSAGGARVVSSERSASSPGGDERGGDRLRQRPHTEACRARLIAADGAQPPPALRRPLTCGKSAPAPPRFASGPAPGVVCSKTPPHPAGPGPAPAAPFPWPLRVRSIPRVTPSQPSRRRQAAPSNAGAAAARPPVFVARRLTKSTGWARSRLHARARSTSRSRGEFVVLRALGQRQVDAAQHPGGLDVRLRRSLVARPRLARAGEQELTRYGASTSASCSVLQPDPEPHVRETWRW